MLIRRELDEVTLERCGLIVVDSYAVAKRECGDLLPLLEKGKLGWGQIGELGDIIIGRIPSRTDEEQITCFESHGMAIQDLIVGARLLSLARHKQYGIELPFGL
jgi:ornithine cyclodeaminase